MKQSINTQKNHAFLQERSSMNPSIDPEINHIIAQEINRQQTEIDLIASENYVSPAVLQATASVLTNKYAEGYPGKRYYAGCKFVDMVETVAIERCKKLFNAPHVNVQPHSGSQANMAAYFAALKPGDTILGMSLAEGGHLTHGHKVNFSGIFYKSVQYTVNRETEQFDFEDIARLAHEHKPKMIVVGASAYSRTIDFEKFSAIAKEVGALLLADIAHIAGLVATGVHPSPIPHADFVTSTTHKTLRGPRGGLIMCKEEYGQLLDRAIIPGTQGGPFMHIIAAKAVAFQEALQPDFKTYTKQIITNAQTLARELENLGYRIVAGGTDNHLFIVDLRAKKVNGKIAQTALERAGISVSRSCIPFDPESPWITSGIRLGTPALTTRGMKEAEMIQVANLIDEVIQRHHDEAYLDKIKKAVGMMLKSYPLY